MRIVQEFQFISIQVLLAAASNRRRTAFVIYMLCVRCPVCSPLKWNLSRLVVFLILSNDCLPIAGVLKMVGPEKPLLVCRLHSEQITSSDTEEGNPQYKEQQRVRL